MPETTDAPGADQSLVSINRLKGGYYSWKIVVTSDHSAEALQRAKEQAVAIIRELEQELKREISEEVPF
jgi:hypothetical protein